MVLALRLQLSSWRGIWFCCIVRGCDHNRGEMRHVIAKMGVLVTPLSPPRLTIPQKGLQGQRKHQTQKRSSVIQLDHSFYKVPGSVQNLKALTFIETSTSMCGAVIVPDLSANQVGVKALKQLIMVNGFTHSVLQMRWSFRSHETSRSGWQRSLIAHSNQSPILT